MPICRVHLASVSQRVCLKMWTSPEVSILSFSTKNIYLYTYGEINRLSKIPYKFSQNLKSIQVIGDKEVPSSDPSQFRILVLAYHVVVKQTFQSLLFTACWLSCFGAHELDSFQDRLNHTCTGVLQPLMEGRGGTSSADRPALLSSQARPQDWAQFQTKAQNYRKCR